ncbi:hypothetical protein LZ30DRAFT_780976 [Colletotrichum cereale]|nr:hypothetical protein LZ30DRAFT_780976 [Colletotrichum cereale]
MSQGIGVLAASAPLANEAKTDACPPSPQTSGNIYSHLKTKSQTMDRFFAKYNNPRSGAVRQKVFDGAV